MSDFEFQPPRVSHDTERTEGFNLSALAVRERSVTLFFLLAIIIAGTVAYPEAWPGRGPNLQHQGFHGDGRMAWRHGAGDAGSGRRAAREADARAQSTTITSTRSRGLDSLS